MEKAKNVGAPEIEVTTDMIEAGVQAYYENAIWGWENPGREELRKMTEAIYMAMSSRDC
jgi:hypothetical protein